MRGISWLGEERLASQKELCSMELVILFINNVRKKFLLKSEYASLVQPNPETASTYLWLECESMLRPLLFPSQARNFLNTWANVCFTRNNWLHWVGFCKAPCYFSGRDSSVGIATFSTLDGVYFNSQWKRFYYSYHPDWLSGPPTLPYNGYRFTLPMVNLSGRGSDHPPLTQTLCVCG